MNIVAPVPIPIFYWKEDLDSYLAAYGVKSFLGNNPAQCVGVAEGDTISELTGKYPIFVGVRFSQMGEFPDIGGAINCVIVGRYQEADAILADWTKLPNLDKAPEKAKAAVKKAMRWKLVLNDYQALTRMGYEVMSNRKRADEVMPLFVKYLIEIFEKPVKTDTEEMVILGAVKHDQFVADNYPKFEAEVIKAYVDPRMRKEVLDKLEKRGRESLDIEERMARLMIERSAMIGEFAGHQVKIAHLPSELKDKAGWLLAKNMPFAVVFEDILKENKRVYHLYSLRGGLNVLEIGEPYGAEGDARYATFTAKIDFSNHKFI